MQVLWCSEEGGGWKDMNDNNTHSGFNFEGKKTLHEAAT